jgi:hypothetical protein
MRGERGATRKRFPTEKERKSKPKANSDKLYK